MSQAERILVVGPAWVGDMVMAHTLFQVLRSTAPDCQIDVVAPAWTEPLLVRMPEVRAAIPLPLGHGQLELGARWRIGRGLRERAYDRAIVLPRAFKAALIPFAARARRRIGFLGELRYGLLNDIRPLDKTALPLTVQRFVALGLPRGMVLPASLPEPRLVADRIAGEAALARLGGVADGAPVLGLCPGAEYGPAKRWPVEHFAALAKARLAAGWQVWLFGSHKDTEVTAQIQALTEGRCLDLGGRTALGEAIDLMAMTTAVVSNDSGLMHVAAALQRPLVAIFGSSDPGHTPPLQADAAIQYLGLECSPCFKRECPLGHLRCLREISPAAVDAALTARLAHA